MAGVLDGRTAVVTGAAHGLGRRIAERFAAEGARVVAVDRAAADGAPPFAESHVLDLAATDAQARLAGIAADLGAVDVLAAVAGVVPPWRRIAALDAAEWDAVLRVNVWGTAVALKAFAGALAASGRGSAILMASINGYRAHPDQALYTASKHAVVGLMRAAALDLGRDGIRVNALAPGPVATEALVGRVAARHAAGGPAPKAAFAALAGETALGRIASEEEVAAAALFLASDLSTGTTGVLLPVECGLG